MKNVLFALGIGVALATTPLAAVAQPVAQPMGTSFTGTTETNWWQRWCDGGLATNGTECAPVRHHDHGGGLPDDWSLWIRIGGD